MNNEAPKDTAGSKSIVSINFDLNSIIIIALGWAAEYAFLSLIEDAPEIIKIGTLVCAVLALFAMQVRTWLSVMHKLMYPLVLITIFVIYCALGVWAFLIDVQ